MHSNRMLPYLAVAAVVAAVLIAVGAPLASLLPGFHGLSTRPKGL